jgi:hypothetical protein
MAHVLAVGKTMCGKSTLFRRIAEGFRKQGRGSIVHIQRDDPDWLKEGKPQAQIRDPEEFLRVAKANRNKLLIVEDAFTQIGLVPKFGLEWLGTDARHEGHTSMFGVQKYTGFAPVLRENCRFIAAFRCGPDSAKKMAEDFCKDEFLECPSLPYGSYIWYDQKKDTLEKRVLFIPKD